MLGSHADAVARRRTEVLGHVAAELGRHGDRRPPRRTRNDVRDLLSGEKAAAGGRGRRRRRALVGASLLAGAAAMAGLVLAGGIDPGGPAPRQEVEAPGSREAAVLGARASAPKPPKGRDGDRSPARERGGERRPRWTFRGAPVALTPPDGASRSRQRRTVRLLSRGEDSRALELVLRGLPRPRGRYALRLYNTSADAVSLASFPVAPRRVTIPLLDDPGSYRFVGLARERAGASPGRPERSILRARVADLVATP